MPVSSLQWKPDEVVQPVWWTVVLRQAKQSVRLLIGRAVGKKKRVVRPLCQGHLHRRHGERLMVHICTMTKKARVPGLVHGNEICGPFQAYKYPFAICSLLSWSQM